MPPIPPITQFLMLACTAIFCLQNLIGLTGLFALFPIASGLFWPWQPLTYAFVHAGFQDLIFSMLALWMFGGELEQLWGRKRYLVFLAAGVLFGALTYLIVTAVFDLRSVFLGSSSAIYALLLASAVLFPTRTVMMIIPPIPMKMRTLVIVFAVIAVLFAVYAGAYSSLAHLGGAIGGWLTIRYWGGQAPFGRRR
ncbi:MAG: rhomboid family intramembrane serine protease [Rhizobacter sp.]